MRSEHDINCGIDPLRQGEDIATEGAELTVVRYGNPDANARAYNTGYDEISTTSGSPMRVMGWDAMQHGLDEHSLTVFAPATDQITIRCRCRPDAMSEDDYWQHLRAALTGEPNDE